MSRAPFVPSDYVPRPALKARLKSLGIPLREIAIRLNMAPGTLTNKLAGTNPLTPSEVNRINSFIRQNREVSSEKNN